MDPLSINEDSIKHLCMALYFPVRILKAYPVLFVHIHQIISNINTNLRVCKSAGR